MKKLSAISLYDNLIANFRDYFDKPHLSQQFHGLQKTPLGATALIKMKQVFVSGSDVFGYRNVLQGNRPKTTVICSTDCVCLEFSGSDFFRVCYKESENPKYVQNALLAHFAVADYSLLEVISSDISSSFLHANQRVLTLKCRGGGGSGGFVESTSMLGPFDILLFVVKAGEITVTEERTSASLCKFTAGSVFGQEQLVAASM